MFLPFLRNAGLVLLFFTKISVSGGIITGNRASLAGGGVYVSSGGIFDQTGGTVGNNSDVHGYPDIAREEDSLSGNSE